MPEQDDLKTQRLLFSFTLALFTCFCFRAALPVPFPAHLALGALLGVGFCRLFLTRLEKEGEIGEVVAFRLKVAGRPSFLSSRTFYYVLHAASWAILWPGCLMIEVLKRPFPSLRGDLD